MFSPRFLLGKRKLSDFDDSIDGYLEQSKRRTRKRFKETNDILAVCAAMSVSNQGRKERKKEVKMSKRREENSKKW